MRTFRDIYATAVLHKGGEAAVEESLPKPKSETELKAIPDDRLLSDLCRRVFRAGLKHALVDAKWPAFEQAFHGFEPYRLMMLSDEELEEQMQNKAIIRHFGKIKSVRTNAAMVVELGREHSSFAELVAHWPTASIVDLWALLKKRGAHLGGHSGARFLRMIGKDTFMLSRDVVAALISQGIVSKEPTAKRDLVTVQKAFNQWREESGRPLCEISRVLSMTADSV